MKKLLCVLPFRAIIAGMAGVLAWAAFLVFAFPYIAAPEGLDSGPVMMFLGFWTGTIPHEQFRIPSVVQWIALHGGGLLFFFAVFQAVSAKLKSMREDMAE